MKFRVSGHERKPRRSQEVRRTRCCVHVPDAQLSRQMTTTCWRSLTPPREQFLVSCAALKWFNALPSLHFLFHLSFHIFTKKKLRAGKADAELCSPRTTATFYLLSHLSACWEHRVLLLWWKMTAKHRKSKNNHKHEENFLKNDVAESEVRTGANSSSVHLVLFLVIVIGGSVGLWFCFQQHQTLTQLTDSVAGMQMKIMKLQSAYEEFRQSGTKVRRWSHPVRRLCLLYCNEKNPSYNKETWHA